MIMESPRFETSVNVESDGSAVRLGFEDDIGYVAAKLTPAEFSNFVERLSAAEVEMKRKLGSDAGALRVARNPVAHQVERTLDGRVLLTFQFADGSEATVAFPAQAAPVLAKDILENARIAGLTKGSA